MARAASPRAPLWALFLAVQLVDVAWAALSLAGIEHFRLDAALPSNPLVLSYMPYTHSLPAAALWAGATFAVGRAWLGARRPALVLAAAVASHWLLDLLVHRPDLPLWGDRYKVGLGLWNLPGPALALEIGMLLAAGVWLLRAGSEPRERRPRLVGLLALLVVVQLVFSTAPVPTRAAVVPAGALAVFLGAAWAARRVERAP